jgi:hypothetical protein
VFGLEADAERIQDLIVGVWLAQCVSVEHIELMWNGYEAQLRETGFGDAVVWFVLRESWRDENGGKEEVEWILEQEEYKELKERVRREVGLRLWKGERRETFLKRCAEERKQREVQLTNLERKKEMRRERSDGRQEVNKKMGDSTNGSLNAETTANYGQSMNTDKILPKTPTMLGPVPSLRVEDRDLAKSTSQLYAEHVHSMRETPSRRPLLRNATNSSSSRLWENPRAVPKPRKKRNLWERLTT